MAIEDLINFNISPTLNSIHSGNKIGLPDYQSVLIIGDSLNISLLRYIRCQIGGGVCGSILYSDSKNRKDGLIAKIYSK